MTSYAVAMDLSARVHVCEDKITRPAVPFAGPDTCGGVGMTVQTPAVWSPAALLAGRLAVVTGFRARLIDVPGPPPRGAPV